MRQKYLIVLSLFSAYLLILVHSVIPHYHADNQQEASNKHPIEHTDHHHGNEKSEGHSNIPHFVHSLDFSHFVVEPTFKFTDVSQVHLDAFYLAPTGFSLSVQHFASKTNWFPDLPPPYASYSPLPNGLRGSPIFIS